MLTVLRDIDRDLLRLVTRRTRFRARLTEGPTAERDLRMSWEEAAARVSRDPRLIRQLFALLQQVDVYAEDADNASAFNLAPVRRPVNLDFSAPGSCRQVRLLMALAAASASQTLFCGVSLNNLEMECLKAFNQLGASIRWEDDGSINCTGTEPVSGHTRTILDKVVHVGDDSLNLYLVLMQLATRAARVKIIGESSLKFMDLSPLRRFLPQLGARFTSVVPGQEGLPARIESSAMLPDAVRVPADLPDDAVTALLLATPFWERPVTVNLEDHPQGLPLLDEALHLLRMCQVQAEQNGLSVTITPGTVHVPARPVLDMDEQWGSLLLALPAFTGGTVCLRGHWPDPETGSAVSRLALDLLAKACLVVRDNEGIRASRLENIGQYNENLAKTAAAASAASAIPGAGEQAPAQPPAPPLPSTLLGVLEDVRGLPPDLLPLGLTLALLPLIRGKKGGLLPVLPETMDLDLLDSFLMQLGLNRQPYLPELPELAELAEIPEMDLTESGQAQSGQAQSGQAQSGQAEQAVPAAEHARTTANESGSTAPSEPVRHSVTLCDPALTPWAAPSPAWATALAMGSFLKQHVKLTNPSVVTTRMPLFWQLFNGLPNPDLTRRQPEKESGHNEKPARRRVLAGFMPESEMPDPLIYVDED